MKLILQLFSCCCPFLLLKRIFVIIYPLTILRHKVGGTRWHLSRHAPSTSFPSANIVILLEPYRGTITEPGFPVSKPAGRLR